MWLLFALIGLLLGEASGGLAGALLGGFLGYALTRLNRIEAQLKALEDERHGRAELDARLSQVEGRLKTLAAGQAQPAETAPPAPEPAPEPIAPAPLSEPFSPAAAPAEPEFEPMPPADQPYPTAPPPIPAWPADDFEQLLGRLFSGNILAKLGMVLLFFGIASALKLAADYGLFPPALRLALAGLAGLACIGAGYGPATGRPFHSEWLNRLAPDSETARNGFGFALEGGGFGILYITTWFALSHFGYLDPTAAFLAFAGLGAACLALAARQDSQSLALLGLLGAFLAPVLVPSQGAHRVLFAYLVLLDTGILALSLHRAWRPLLAMAFLASVLLGLGWADESYREAIRPDVEVFVLALFLLFSATPWLAARRGPPPRWGWESSMLLFGPPTAAAVAQSGLYYGDLDFLALSSLATGLWYGLLFRLTRRSGAELLAQAQAGLALTFLSLAPWLAFSQNVAGVFWALEGGGVVWYALRSGRRLPLLAGSLLQALSGLLLLDLWTRGPDGMPFRDSLFAASLLLVAAAGLSAWASRAQPSLHRAFLVWALLWWFGIFHEELRRTLEPDQVWTLLALLAATTAFALEGLGRRFALPDLRAASLLILPFLAAAVAENWLGAGHPLANGLWLVMAAALAVHYLGLFRQEADGVDWFVAERHVLGFWLALAALAWEATWLVGRFPGLGASMSEALRALVLAAALILVPRAGPAWPLGPHRNLYLKSGLALPAVLAWLWLFSLPIGLTGAWALPYLPLLNPLEGTALLLLWALHGHWRAAGEFGPAHAYPALFGLALLYWLSLILARVVHHWAGVPFLPDELWHSALLQALLSLSWTAYGLVAMVLASRRRLRPVWFAGLALLLLVCGKLVAVDLANVSGLLRVLSLIGVGLLVLGAGYLAPVPPREDQPATSG